MVYAVRSLKFIPVGNLVKDGCSLFRIVLKNQALALAAGVSTNCDSPPKLSLDISLLTLNTEVKLHLLIHCDCKTLTQTL